MTHKVRFSKTGKSIEMTSTEARSISSIKIHFPSTTACVNAPGWIGGEKEKGKRREKEKREREERKKKEKGERNV